MLKNVNVWRLNLFILLVNSASCERILVSDFDSMKNSLSDNRAQEFFGEIWH